MATTKKTSAKKAPTVKTSDVSESSSEDKVSIAQSDGSDNTTERREGKGLPVSEIEGGYMGNYSSGDYSKGRHK